MKIILSKNDVMEIIYQKYAICTTYIAGQVVPEGASVYWEGNPEKKEE